MRLFSPVSRTTKLLGAAMSHGGGDEPPMEPITDDDIPF